MFEEHQPQIGRFARQSPVNMAKVYTFVLATVQQSLHSTPAIMEDIALRGIESRYLWGFKADAYEFLTENMNAVYETSMSLYLNHADPEVARSELLRYFAGLPGLGLVKGGFMVQLCFGYVGCLDTHNIAIFELNDYEFKSSRFKSGKTKTQKKLVKSYLSLVDKIGGCDFLWDNWCRYVARKYPERYKSAVCVSRLHVEAIGAMT